MHAEASLNVKAGTLKKLYNQARCTGCMRLVVEANLEEGEELHEGGMVRGQAPGDQMAATF